MPILLLFALAIQSKKPVSPFPGAKIVTGVSISAERSATGTTVYKGWASAQIVPVRRQSFDFLSADLYLQGEDGTRRPVATHPIRSDQGDGVAQFAVSSDLPNWSSGLDRWRGSLRVKLSSGSRSSTFSLPVDEPVYIPDRPAAINPVRVGQQFLSLGAIFDSGSLPEDFRPITLASISPSGATQFRTADGTALSSRLPLHKYLAPIRDDASVRAFRERYLGKTVYFRQTESSQMNAASSGEIRFGTAYRVVKVYRLAQGYVPLTLRYANMDDANKGIVAGDPFLVVVQKSGAKGMAETFSGRFAGIWHFERCVSLSPPSKFVIRLARRDNIDVAKKGMTRDDIAWLNGYPGDELSVADLNRLPQWDYQELAPFSWGVTFRGNRVASVQEPGNLP